MKKRRRETMERIELLNQKSVRMLGGKENYEYIGILDFVINNMGILLMTTEILKKDENITSNERENVSKSNIAAEISS